MRINMAYSILEQLGEGTRYYYMKHQLNYDVYSYKVFKDGKMQSHHTRYG